MAVDAVRAKSLFLAASDLPDVAERAAYLDRECRGDAELRGRVEALLRANDAAPLPPAGEAGATSDLPQGRLVREEDLATTPPEGPGTRLGPYKLLQKLGEGGMGTVWMAEQEQPVQRRVALKVIKAGRDSGQVLARFEAERQALALMDHPNIARVLDAGETASGRPYFVMELVKGIPINAYCDQEHLTPQERLSLFIPVCQAVQHAHQKGIIHRDLKPSNVLVALYDGVPVPKVIDFGIAKATAQKLTEHTLFTEVGQIVGTLEYMSPEQAELNNLDIDTRADIYSLGVLLYELLTGSPPFTSKQLRSAAFTEMLRIIREVEPPKPSTKLSSSDELPNIAAKRKLEPKRLTRLMHGDLDWIVMKCLEKERGRRYETANALAIELQRYLADEPVLAGPPGASYRMRKFVRRHRGPVLAAGSLLLALVWGVAGTTWGLVRAERTRQAEAEARQAEAEQRQKAQDKEQEALGAANQEREAREREAEQRRLAEARREDLRRNLYFSQVQLAKQAWDDADIPRVLALLEANGAAASANETDLRGFEWYYLWRLCHSELFTVRHPSVRSVCFSPDGKHLASRGTGAVSIWNVATGEEVRTIRNPVPNVFYPGVSSVCFSPDSNRLAGACADQTVRIWDTRTAQEVVTFKGHSKQVNNVTFSPDGKFLASASTDQTVKVWDARTGEEILCLGGSSGAVVSCCFSPDGRRLAGVCLDKTAKVWDARTGQEIFSLKDAFGICFSPDGKRMASCRGLTMRVWDAESGSEALTFKGHNGQVTSVCFSPDGQRLASASWDRTVKVWDAPTGEERLTFKGHTSVVYQVCFSPDGRRLASASPDGTVRVWSTHSGQEHHSLSADHAVFSFSPDGKRLVSVSRRVPQTAKVWDVQTGLEILSLGGHDGPVVACSFSPDGRRLASSGGSVVKVWDAETGEEKLTIKGHDGVVGSVCFSPDGKRLASGAGETLKVWDAQTGKEILTLEGGGRYVDFSADGMRLASVTRDLKEVKVLDAQTGREHLVLKAPGTSRFNCVCFSPAGDRLATASVGNVTVWDAHTGREILTLKGGTQRVCFSPDGRRLVSGAGIMVKVWDAQTGQEALSLKGHTTDVFAVHFSADGNSLASMGGGQDRAVKIWDARPLSPELQIEGEASGVVRFLFSKPLLQAEVLAALRVDPTIDEPVRREALALASYSATLATHQPEGRCSRC